MQRSLDGDKRPCLDNCSVLCCSISGQTSLYFVGDEAIKDTNCTQILLGNRDLLSLTLPHDEIKELHKRWYQLRDNAIEIFLTNGKTTLLAFSSTRVSYMSSLRDGVMRVFFSFR